MSVAAVSSSHLDQLEAEAITVLREAWVGLKPLVMLWSLGKDSNVVLWLTRKAFFGHVPWPLALLDTGKELPEVYAFRDRMVAEWRLDCLAVDCPPDSATDPTLPPKARAAARKTLGLQQLIAERELNGVILGIRRDEQAVRGKERVFSLRTADGAWDPTAQALDLWGFVPPPPSGGHVRVHPLLDWSELDVWRYIRREGVPIPDLYFARDGLRYRSLGEADITHPIASTAADIDAVIAELEATRTPERAGRSMDRETEDAFERLRRAGYM
ncbi:MAG: sulfate adenylyltransferase subunit CysD [Alphaproteobacteria bacterium]|nr:sulfate adenylyltransferase subunit CysD [Alphaproteobacteria bacterium]